MTRIANESELSPTPPLGRWSAIVPAAGRGSRLGYERPKVLYPVLGKPILAWLLETLEPLCAEVTLVLSPAGASAVEAEARRWIGSARLRIAIQSEPRGMGHAVLCAEREVSHSSCVVVWGDQVTLRRQTIARLITLHESRAGALLTLATIERRKPYIHFERDGEGRIVHVHEARRAPIPVDVGENDCGLFAFNSAALFELLREARPGPHGELDLLPLFPGFERASASVATLRISDPGETQGVNTVEEAARAEEILRVREGA